MIASVNGAERTRMKEIKKREIDEGSFDSVALSRGATPIGTSAHFR